MPNYQDGADAYGAYTQGSHIGGVIRKRYMGNNQLAEARKMQARDGTTATAFGAGGLSSRPAQSTGRRAVMEEADRADREATMQAARAGAARAAAEVSAPVNKPAAKPEPVPATKTPMAPMAVKSAAGVKGAIKAARQRKAKQDRNYSRQRVELERDQERTGKKDPRLAMGSMGKFRERARAAGALDTMA